MAMRFMRHPQARLHLPEDGREGLLHRHPHLCRHRLARLRPSPSSPIEETGVKYPLADYELMPKMAIVDADMMMNAPKGLTCRFRHRRRDARPGGLRLHDGHRLHRRPGACSSLKMIFEYLPARLRQRPERSPRPARRWPTPPPWPAWRLPTPSSACATPWRTSWARSITCRTAWPTR